MSSSLRSMTGFGSGEIESEDLRIKVELRSVNHRYLKTSYHLSDRFSSLQGKVDMRLREQIGRGAIHLSVFVEDLIEDSEGLDVDLIKSRYAQICKLRDELAPSQEVRLTDVVAMNQDNADQAGSSNEKADDQLLEVIDLAVADLREMQKNEGDRLQEEFLRLLLQMEKALGEIEAALPEAMEWLRDRYHNRIQQLVGSAGGELDDQDLVREIGVLAEKSDITEELSRLRGHVDEYRKVVGEGGRVGRRLDFLTQEMFREANTMTSKLPRHDLAHTVVGIKVDVDRLREQTQNVE
ncbi:MAG: YicC family protein [Planctomycetia bacterium]|nr:YicC family protein [Planctomycetia bacterium]MBL6915798.1 YicC family protein [Planctomycetota bacterium]HCW44128.1 YicC family protein [Planctomycetota bacterium]